jgi:sortase A
MVSGAVIGARALYIPIKAEIAQVLLTRAWDESVTSGRAIKPWAWADMKVAAKLDAPRLGQSAIILAGASGQAMAFGPAHMSNTPAFGEPGASVVSAHRDTHFRFLKDVEIGDRFVATTLDGATLEYKVTETRVVHAGASGIDPTDGGETGSRLIMTTCYPFDAQTRGPLRYAVFASRVVENPHAFIAENK